MTDKIETSNTGPMNIVILSLSLSVSHTYTHTHTQSTECISNSSLEYFLSLHSQAPFKELDVLISFSESEKRLNICRAHLYSKIC